MNGQRFAGVASQIEADANKPYSAPKVECDFSMIEVDTGPRAGRNYLEVLNEAAFGAAASVWAKFTSRTDPAGQWTAA